MRLPPIFLKTVVVVGICVFPASVLVAADLRELSLEDLLDLEVYSAGKKEEQLFTVPTAIDVLTGEEVSRSGATSIGEALRLAAGLHVARDEVGSWAISARGFSSEQGNKMQVVIDGRNVYTLLYGGVFWDAQDILMEDLDRIEVVRGPGATLWGANAVNGVINILTKDARETQGGLLSVGGGVGEKAFAAARYGGTISADTHYRVYLKSFSRNGMTDLQGDEIDGDYNLVQSGFRLDSEALERAHVTIQGDLYSGEAIVYESDNDIRGGNLLARYEREFGDDSTWSVQGYYDRVERELGGEFGEIRDTFDLELEFKTRLGRRHEVVSGFDLRSSSDDTIQGSVVDFMPPSKTINLLSAYVQDEISLIEDRLSVTLGVKAEKNSYSDWELQPNLRLGWRIAPGHFLWAAVSRAVRTPARLDHDVSATFGEPIPLIVGNPDFVPEELVATELGYRLASGDDFTIDLSLFRNIYDDLRLGEPSLLSPTAPLPLVYRNSMNAEATGAELIARVNLGERWRIHAKYSYLDLDLDFDPGSLGGDSAYLESNSPQHVFVLQNLWQVTPKWQIDATLRHVAALPYGAIDAYTELDLRVGWQVTDGLLVEVVGRNLLDDQHPEFLPSIGSVSQVARGGYARLTYRF